MLKAFAARRGNGAIAVTGYGDATSSDPDAQSAALSLGLSRAQAMANALTGDGVPGSGHARRAPKLPVAARALRLLQ